MNSSATLISKMIRVGFAKDTTREGEEGGQGESHGLNKYFTRCRVREDSRCEWVRRGRLRWGPFHAVQWLGPRRAYCTVLKSNWTHVGEWKRPNHVFTSIGGYYETPAREVSLATERVLVAQQESGTPTAVGITRYDVLESCV